MLLSRSLPVCVCVCDLGPVEAEALVGGHVLLVATAHEPDRA